MIMKRFASLVLVVFCGVTSRLSAHDEPFKVPFDTLQTKHIVVMVTINDKGPYRMIFDTGAPVTLLGSRAARDSGVIAKDAKGAGFALFDIPQFKIKTLEMGSLKTRDLATVVLDHPTVTAIDKTLGPVDGIMGLSFFGKYRFTIDYQAKEMTFVPVKFTPPEVMKHMLALLMSDKTPAKKVLAPAAQWGFSVAKGADDQDAGVDVKTVLEGSPAAKAGLKSGDRLLTVDGRWTDSVVDCYYAAAFVQPSSEVRLVVLRQGKELELKVVVTLGL
jgi:hypothetical protein